MDTITTVITVAAYGRGDCYHGFFLPVITISEEIQTSVLLIEDGVFCALRKEQPKDIGHPGLAELVSAIIKLGGKVYVDTRSCEVRGVKEEELVEGVETVSPEKEARILLEAQGTIVV